MSARNNFNYQLNVKSQGTELIPAVAKRSTRNMWFFLAVTAVVTWTGYGKWSLLPIAIALIFGIRAAHSILKASGRRLETARKQI